MKRRDKRIIVVVIIGCLVFGIALVAYFPVWVMRDLNRMEARRLILLYETDHRALLQACRKISRQVATGRLEPGSYQIHGAPDPESRQFSQLILDLDPLQVNVKKNGLVDILMSPVVIYGVVAYPENYGSIPDDSFKYEDRLWGIELIDGLWYYDEDFQNNPEHMKEVEELLKKRKAGDSSGVP